ncbi:hypothetical protein B0J17DRAFT_651764 [Rhizoctonia solani]|nr:hypothetical protein B0J17DRAFT_651764 [Rhizoctonia solani]
MSRRRESKAIDLVSVALRLIEGVRPLVVFKQQVHGKLTNTVRRCNFPLARRRGSILGHRPARRLLAVDPCHLSAMSQLGPVAHSDQQ